MTCPAKYFPVTPGIWNKRLLSLGHRTTLVFFYTLTNAHRASEGLFRLPIDYIAADLELEREAVVEALQALEGEQLIMYDWEAEVMLDVNAFKVQLPKNPIPGKRCNQEAVATAQTPLLKEKIAEAYGPVHDPPSSNGP